MTTDIAKGVLAELAKRLDTQTIAAFCKKRLFGTTADVPMMKWSVLNQFICFVADTVDARGFDQWRKVGRWPRKGSKAFYILAPIFRTIPAKPFRNDDEKEGQEQTAIEIKVLCGFRSVPVFRMEDTEGNELAYQRNLRQFDPSGFPLYQLAVSMGVTVRAGITPNAYGYFSPTENAITLCTDDVTTFMHELSHKIDYELPGHRDDYNYNEVVAELSSCFLCTLYGLPHHEQSTRAYIESYSEGQPIAARMAEAMDRVMQIYSYIENWQTTEAEKVAQ
jgi:hypothetical protein